MSLDWCLVGANTYSYSHMLTARGNLAKAPCGVIGRMKPDVLSTSYGNNNRCFDIQIVAKGHLHREGPQPGIEIDLLALLL